MSMQLAASPLKPALALEAAGQVRAVGVRTAVTRAGLALVDVGAAAPVTAVAAVALASEAARQIGATGALQLATPLAVPGEA